MARTAVVGGSGGGFLSKAVSALVVLAVIVFIVKSPHQAADLFTTLWGWLRSAIEAGVAFLEYVSR